MKVLQSTLLLISILFVTSCSGPSSPEFNGIEDLKISKARLNNIVLVGRANYTNHNSIGGELVKTNITIFVDNVEVTTINQKESIDVPSNASFDVPVLISFNPKGLIKENKGFLKNSLKNLFKKDIELTYKGYVTIDIAGFEFDIPVDYSEKLNIGMNYN